MRQAVEAHAGNEHVVACLGHEMVGDAYCIIVPLNAGGRATARVWVVAAVRGRGVGSALWSAVLATVRKASVRGVFTVVDVADSRSLEIARAHGLVEIGVRTESRLDLQGLDDAMVGAAVDHVLSRGIEIDAWAGGADETAWELLYQDLVPLFGDTPDGQQGHEPPSLEFLRREFRQPWQVLLGRRGDRNVGATLVMARATAPDE